MTAEFIILGCGNAAGTPAIGDDWGKCDPKQPRNRRTRAAAAIKTDQGFILIDFGPDIHFQLTREKITHIASILLSHDHGDHVNGIDDMRTLAFRNGEAIDLYGHATSLETIEQRFPYAFGKVNSDLYKAFLKSHTLDMNAIALDGITVHPFEQDHGTCTSLGFRIGHLAYSTDMRDLDDKAVDTLKGIDTWIVDGGAYHNEHNPVHANLKTIYALNERIGASKVYLTHLPRNMDYDVLMNELPDGYQPAYDGLRFSL